MRDGLIALRVAKWEFRRFYRTKEILWGIVIILGIFLGQKIVIERVAAAGRGTKTIAVLGAEHLPDEVGAQERFAFAVNERASQRSKIAASVSASSFTFVSSSTSTSCAARTA